MDTIHPTRAALDRAYADGRLVGFLGLATRAGCPFTVDRQSLRTAWLDGFLDGRSEVLADTGANAPIRGETTNRDERTAPLEVTDASLADIAIAHLHRLLQQINDTADHGAGYSAACQAAGAFLSLVSLAQRNQPAATANGSQQLGA
jgi:hypothetical protein